MDDQHPRQIGFERYRVGKWTPPRVGVENAQILKIELAEKIGLALSEITVNHGVDLLEEPRRSVGILADLVGDPQMDSSVEIEAIRIALDHVTVMSQSERSLASEADVVAVLVDSGIDESTARAILPLIVGATDLRFRREAAASFGLSRSITVLVTVLMTTLAIWWLLPNRDAGGEGSTPTTITAPAATDSPPDGTEPEVSEPEVQSGVVAAFPTVQEGSFLVTRGWRVTPGGGEIVGLVYLEVAGSDAINAQHRELAPTTPISDSTTITWQPQPDATFNNVAVFNVALRPGETMEIEFRAPLAPGGAVDEIGVYGWFETWRSQSEEIRPLGSSDLLLEPVITRED